MFKVSKRTLLLIAGIVWLAAGGNIAWLGIQAFAQINMSYVWAIILGAVVVFTLFPHVRSFSKMVGKHSNRIAAYEDNEIGFWRFFDASGYIMMAIMMSGGISLRALAWCRCGSSHSSTPVWASRSRFRASASSYASHAAAAPPHRAPLASLRPHAERNRAREVLRRRQHQARLLRDASRRTSRKAVGRRRCDQARDALAGEIPAGTRGFRRVRRVSEAARAA